MRCGSRDGDGAGQMRATQTDERGGFDVTVPTGGDDRWSHPRCEARVLGGAEQLYTLGGSSWHQWSPLCSRGAAPSRRRRCPTPPRARKMTPWQMPATPSPRHAGDGLWKAIWAASAHKSLLSLVTSLSSAAAAEIAVFWPRRRGAASARRRGWMRGRYGRGLVAAVHDHRVEVIAVHDHLPAFPEFAGQPPAQAYCLETKTTRR
uniref:Uncharacterized protein n=1 Tax=Oryza punctata TaxID=4537 RepID=A0A0E0K4S9_ORYPU